MKKTIIFTIVVLWCASCHFLDEEPVHYLIPESQFAEEKNVEFAVNECYSYLPDGYLSFGGAFSDVATDDAVFCRDNAGVVQISRSQITSSNYVIDTWSRSYKGISQTFLVEENLKYMYIPLQPAASENMEEYMDSRRNMYKAEAMMVRAYLYFDLLRHYGGVPIVDHVLTPEDKITELERSDYAAVVDTVVALCDRAAGLYPQVFHTVPGKWGKGAAMAIKAKTLAYAASDLYNNVDNPLLGYASGSQEERVEKAIKALHDVIALGEYGLSGSYDTFNSAPNIANANVNIKKEWIVYKGRAKGSGYEKSVFPPSLGGKGTIFPSQNFVDSFDNLDGTAFEPGSRTGEEQWKDRDPRLSSCVIVNGQEVRKGTRVYTYLGDNQTIDANGVIPEQSTLTGYYLKKFASYQIDFDKTKPGTTYHMYPMIRYSDILLLYAEKMNANYGPDDAASYSMSAKDAVTLVRSRAGIKNPELEIADPAEFMEKVKKERRIELCFEDQRFYDLRRWKDADEVLNGSVGGIRITNAGGNYSYETVTVDSSRKFDKRMYYFPIPYSDQVNGLEQNPGWN